MGSPVLTRVGGVVGRWVTLALTHPTVVVGVGGQWGLGGSVEFFHGEVPFAGDGLGHDFGGGVDGVVDEL